MIRDLAVAEVQQIAGWRSDKATQIAAALQYAQDEREKPGRSYPWWLRKDVVAFTTVANDPSYDIPADYIQDTEEKEGNIYIYTIAGQVNSRTVFLRKQSFEDAQVRYYGNWPYIYSVPSGALTDQTNSISPGVPIDYYLGDTFVNLYPVPNDAYQVRWRYWGKAATQATGQENAWLANAPWVLIGAAARKICMDLQYQEGVQTANQILNEAEATLFRSVVAREESGRRRNMGSRL